MSPITIVLDAVNGAGPTEAAKAAATLSRESTIFVVLVGEATRLEAELSVLACDRARLRIHPAAGDGGELERDRERARREALAAACGLVAAGEADAVVSSAPSRVLVQVAQASLPLLPGLTAPALATVFPTRQRSFSNDRFALLLDVGATVHASADELCTFALMGQAYARRISKLASPAVALLNVAASEDAGDPVLQAAHAMMQKTPELNFIGNVDGTGVVRGTADVFVCEGYVGSVVAKSAAGLYDLVDSLGAWAWHESVLWRLGLMLLSRGLGQMRRLTDYREYGGAPFLGLSHLVLKTPSDSQAPTLVAGIKIAAKAVRDRVVADIAQALVSRQA